MAAVNITAEKFSQLTEADRPVLVDYWAPWCSYCRRIGPAYDKIAQQYSEHLLVTKVNIDDEPILADGQQIEVIPTLVMYRDGKPLGFVVAPESKAQIDDFIRDTLAQ